MDPKDCVVLVPVAAAIEPETLDRLSRLIDRGYRVETLRGCSAVDMARNVLASDAILRGGYAELMWVDSDVVFDPDAVETLRSHGEPLTCGLYAKKGRREFAAKFLPGTKAAAFGPGGGLLEIEYAGFGFVHARREVFERVERRWGLPRCVGGYDPEKEVVPYFLPMVTELAGRWQYLGEDSAFFHRARACGFRVLADTTIKLGHVGRVAYTWDDLTPRERFDGIELTFTDNGG